MKKFKFRLEPLLKLKAYREKENQKVHAAAHQKVLTQENKLVAINSERGTNQKELLDYLHGRLNLPKLTGYSRYFLKLRKDELTGWAMLKVLSKDAEEKRLRLLEATCQRKIFEKLKEHHRDNHRKESDLLDQKEQDEIGTQMFDQKKDS